MLNQENECLTISVDAASKLLGISRGLAYEMVRQGKIPALRFGRVIRVPRYALEQLLSKGIEELNNEAAPLIRAGLARSPADTTDLPGIT